MNLFDLLNPRMFRPLTGRNQRIYADLLMLIWDRCSTSQDYSIGKGALTELAETYMEGLGTILPLDEEDSPGESATDARSQGLLFVRRLRDAGWVEDLEGGYEEENRTALSALAVRLLQLFDELLHPKTVTYSGKLLKAYRLLQDMEHEKSPYENVLKEVSADMADLNTSLRQLNASIGSYIDQLTRNRTPQEVLDLFQQYEDEVVVAAYHRFKTSDNLFQYRAWMPATGSMLRHWLRITAEWSGSASRKPPLQYEGWFRKCGMIWRLCGICSRRSIATM